MRNTNRVLAAAVVAFSLSVAGGPAVVAQEPTGTVTQGVVVTDKPDNPGKPPKEDNPGKPPKEDNPGKPPKEDNPNKPPKEDKPGRPGKNTAPVIVGAVDATIELDSTFNALDGVTATDKEDGDLASSITVTGTVDTATPGPYTITYQVTDSGNLTTAESRVITVNTAPEPEPVPNTAPVLTGVTDATITEGDEFMPLYGVTATDTEDGDLTAAITVTGYVDTLTIGDYSLTYQVADTGGLTATASRTITVIAAEPIQGIPPTITGVDDITVIEGDPFDPYAGVTATDNDGNDLTSDVTVTGTVDTSTPGVYTLTYTVTDTSGTSETATRNVTVLANAAPTLDGVTDETIREGDTFDPMAGVTATDTEDGNLTDQVTITGTVDTDTPGDYQLTYTVIDSRGKDTSRLRVITVTPNLAPTITGADDTTITVGDTFDPTFGVTAVDAEDGDITDQVVITGTVNTATVSVYTLTYTVTDTGGKTATVTRSVTVEPEPNWAPVLDGVTNESIIEGATFDPLAGVTATDHEDGDLTGRVIITGHVDTTPPGQYLLTYSVTDTAGETVTATRVITVVFNQPPTLSGVDGAAVTVGDTFDALAGVTALDAEDGDLTDAIVVTGTVNTGTVGVYTITYTVTDAHGKSTSVDRPVTVNAAPNTEPVLAGVTDTSIIEGATFDPATGVTATDAEDGNLTDQVTIAGTVDTGTPGVYDLTYRVTDTAGATVTAARTVTVIANAAPTITGADDTTITVGDVFDPATGVTATDAEDGDLTDAITITGTVDTGTVGVYTLTYEVTDSNGKTATVTRAVTVEAAPNTAPVLDGVDNTSIIEGATFDPTSGVTATDVEDGDLTADITITGTVNTTRPGVYTLTYTVEDSHGLADTATRTVTVIANAAPTITGADDTTITVGDVFDPAAGVIAADKEDGNITHLLTITGTVDTGTVGVHTLTYEVTDSNGKTATTIRTVTVNPVPNTEPVLFGVTDTTVTEGDLFDPYAGVTAHDAEDGDLTAAIAITGTVDTGTTGVYTLTYTVTDTGGLTTTATRTVTVTESTADPYITDYERAVTDKVFELVNAHRASIGIDPLIRDADIDTVAYAWSQVMADQGTMYHNPNYATQMPDGWYRAAENVVSSSMTYTDMNRMATLIVNTWLGSDGHRATIENPNYTHTGIGFQVAENGAIYGTQNFGDYTP